MGWGVSKAESGNCEKAPGKAASRSPQVADHSSTSPENYTNSLGPSLSLPLSLKTQARPRCPSPCRVAALFHGPPSLEFKLTEGDSDSWRLDIPDPVEQDTTWQQQQKKTSGTLSFMCAMSGISLDWRNCLASIEINQYDWRAMHMKKVVSIARKSAARPQRVGGIQTLTTKMIQLRTIQPPTGAVSNKDIWEQPYVRTRSQHPGGLLHCRCKTPCFMPQSKALK